MGEVGLMLFWQKAFAMAGKCTVSGRTGERRREGAEKEGQSEAEAEGERQHNIVDLTIYVINTSYTYL